MIRSPVEFPLYGGENNDLNKKFDPHERWPKKGGWTVQYNSIIVLIVVLLVSMYLIPYIFMITKACRKFESLIFQAARVGCERIARWVVTCTYDTTYGEWQIISTWHYKDNAASADCCSFTQLRALQEYRLAWSEYLEEVLQAKVAS